MIRELYTFVVFLLYCRFLFEQNKHFFFRIMKIEEYLLRAVLNFLWLCDTLELCFIRQIFREWKDGLFWLLSILELLVKVNGWTRTIFSPQIIVKKVVSELCNPLTYINEFLYCKSSGYITGHCNIFLHNLNLGIEHLHLS